MNENKLLNMGRILTKIFLIWLLIQFFVQTFVTYKLWLQGWFFTVLRAWKEIIILWLLAMIGYYFYQKRNIESFFEHTPLKSFIMIFGATILITFLVSIIINGTWLSAYLMSIRYSMIGFLIFIVFFVRSSLFFGSREIGLVKRYAKIMKTLLIVSLFRWGIIRLIPNLLKFAWYNQYNYEWQMGVAPPAAYYTQYDQWYVRNQFIFERPISRGFFLIAFRPLFFILCIKNKSRWEKALRSTTYGLVILSTFSRAAWIAWIIQTLILIFLQFKRQFRKAALYGFVPLFAVFVVVTYFGQKQIISREFSNTGHFRMIAQALTKVADRPLRGQGAGSAGPASFQVKDQVAYNPENQYLQIRIEYWFLWFAGWMLLYGYLHWIGYKSYEEDKDKKNKIIKKTKLYGVMVFAFSLWLLGLSIEWLVLQSFVDRMIVYPFMALFAITYALYIKSLPNHLVDKDE